jgi:amino acid transporter
MTTRAGFGLGTLIALVMASMIGAGVYTTSGFALADLGSPGYVMAAWFAGSLIALCGAVSYGAVAQKWTESGGEYLFLSRAVHPWAGFLAGWISLLAGFTSAIALSAVTLEAYALPFFSPGWQEAMPPKTIAIGVILLGGALHGIHRRTGVIGQNFLVGLKIALIVAFVAWGGLMMASRTSSIPLETENLKMPFSWQAFAMSLVWISLSFSGFNAAIYVAGEAQDAGKNVPRGMLIGTLLVAGIYLGLNGVILWSAPPKLLAGERDVAAVAARALGGETMEWSVRGMIACGLVSSVASMILAGPRVYAQMANDNVFPAWFASRASIPRRAVFLQVALSIFVASSASIRELLSYMGFTLSLCSAAAIATIFQVQRGLEGPSNVDRWKSWFRLRFIPATYIVLTISLAVLGATMQPRQFIAALATIGSGSLVYLGLTKISGKSAN